MLSTSIVAGWFIALNIVIKFIRDNDSGQHARRQLSDNGGGGRFPQILDLFQNLKKWDYRVAVQRKL